MTSETSTDVPNETVHSKRQLKQTEQCFESTTDPQFTLLRMLTYKWLTLTNNGLKQESKVFYF